MDENEVKVVIGEAAERAYPSNDQGDIPIQQRLFEEHQRGSLESRWCKLCASSSNGTSDTISGGL